MLIIERSGSGFGSEFIMKTNLAVKKNAFDAMEISIRIILYALLLYMTMPMFFFSATPGLDPSGMYILNVASSNGLKMGSDLVLTYGPLGFLSFAGNFGNNGIISCTVYMLLTLLEGFLLFPVYFNRDKCSITRLAITTIIWCSTLTPMASIGIDLYVDWILLLALSLAWFANPLWRERYFVIACLLTVFLAFIKFSGCMTALSALIIFAVIWYVKDKKQGKRFAIILMSVPVLFLICYIFYNPSLQGLFRYVKSTFELSSGYNTAMSVWDENWKLKLGIGIIAAGAYCLLLIFVLWADLNRGLYMLIFCGPFFVVFKLGYVRADGHTFLYFIMFLIYICIIVLFVDFHLLKERLSKYTGKVACAAAIMVTLMACLTFTLPVYMLNNSPQTLISILKGRYQALTSGISYALDNPITGENPLPQELLERIGNESIAAYPWEQSIFAYNDLNMRVMPVFGAYSAYTPYLDKLNADFFSNNETAPTHILLQMDAIDGRYPLIETPVTWSAIRTHYKAEYYLSPYLLLTRDEGTQVSDTIELFEKSYHKSEAIEVPQSEGQISMRIDAELTLLGRLAKFFYQIPEVDMSITYASGAMDTGRVLPEMLTQDTMINYVTRDLTQCARIINEGVGSDPVAYINFSGPGWYFYKNEVKVVFSESK